MSSDRISPTAHYTGHVWARNGLSHPALQTLEGRLLYESLRGVVTVNELVGGNSLERYLLARHRSIDLLLERAIDSGRVTQVIEVACGMSARGWRFSSRYGGRIEYVEADLPGMAQRKREALRRMGTLSEHHRVVEVDALADGGPSSLSRLAATLDRERGTAVITEGLLGYLDTSSVTGLWRRLARMLSVFPAGLYLSDLHLGSVQDLQIRAFRVLLSAFVRGSVHLHFDTAQDAVSLLHSAGFGEVEVCRAEDLLEAGSRRGGGSQLVHIIEASTVPPASR